MKLIAQVKLQPTAEQADALRRTLEASNAAANFLSDLAWSSRMFRQYDLHHAAYYDLRKRFGLSAQATARVISKVADAYKKDKRSKRTFKPLGSIAYDSRILSWKKEQHISIWTVDGRQTIPFVAGDRQIAMLANRQGEADLVYRGREFYLYQTCDIEESEVAPVEDYIGVDMGVVNIAVDSDGNVQAGNQINNVRHRHRRLRTKLQRKGTRSSRRRLKRLSGKESRFAKHVNHEISKRVVDTAQRTGRGIAVEDLAGIRDRIRARRSQRAILHSWSFHELRSFIEYKARLAGVPVVAVDPHNTSRTCPSCGHIDKANRPNQATFSCVQCGFSGLADRIAAENIRRAAVNRPCVSDAPSIPVQRQGQSPRL